MKKQPLRLAKDPIVEAIAELRFEPAQPNAGDLLPGMIFPDVKDVLPKIERLPLAEMPRQIQEADVNLKYGPTQRLSGNQFALLLGNRVATIACAHPYVGWEKFRSLINRILLKINSTGMVKNVERFSVKYVNLLEAKDRIEQYAFLNLKASLGQYSLTDHLSNFRTEIAMDRMLTIVEITPAVDVQTQQGAKLHGLLFSIDTICVIGNDFWKEPLTVIDDTHATEKSIFYDLLTEKAIESFIPIWS